MSFLLPCPNCGPRSVYEFQFGGEYHPRPRAGAPLEEWIEYLYFKRNSPAEQMEWWYHRQGCRLWFLAVRHNSTNEVQETLWPQERRRANARLNVLPSQESS